MEVNLIVLFVSLVSEEHPSRLEMLEMLYGGLDKPSSCVIKGWQHLAVTTEINAPLRVRLSCRITTTESCTRFLFEVLISRFPRMKVEELMDALTKIKRNDVKDIIEKACPGMLACFDRLKN